MAAVRAVVNTRDLNTSQPEQPCRTVGHAPWSSIPNDGVEAAAIAGELAGVGLGEFGVDAPLTRLGLCVGDGGRRPVEPNQGVSAGSKVERVFSGAAADIENVPAMPG